MNKSYQKIISKKVYLKKILFCNILLLDKLFKSLEKYEKISKSFYKGCICLFTSLANITHAKKIKTFLKELNKNEPVEFECIFSK